MNSLFKLAAAMFCATLPVVPTIAQTPLVNRGDSWRYHKGTNAPQVDWKTAADAGLDGTWPSGPGGFGFADNTNETNQCRTILFDMRGSTATNYTTIYMRKQFTIGSAVDTNLHLVLSMDFDDGFIAWLDGVYLTSQNVTGAPTEPARTATASGLHESSRGSTTGTPPAAPALTNDLGAVGARLGLGTHTLAIMGLNESATSSDCIQIADLFLTTNTPAATNCISGVIAANATWYASNSPIVVCGNVVINSGVTVTVEPGVTVQLAAGVGINVNGRLLAEGTSADHIHITKQPAGGNWRTLDFLNTPVESRLAYIDFDSCAGASVGGHNAQLHVNGGSIIFIDHCTWPSTPVVEYISFDASSFIVQNCTFPTYSGTTGPESLHGVNGIPLTGYGIFRDNYFGHTYGFNDTIDFTGGNRPGAILQILNNVFDGASDDHLDLDSTDAWIEGNVFLHAHRDPTRTDDARDTASAISGGVDNVGQNPDWTIINNLFYDVDHIFLNKGNSTTVGNGGGRIAFLFNTVIHVAKEGSGSTQAEIAAFNWSDDGIALPNMAVGSGLYAANNIIYDCQVLNLNYNPANQTVIMDNNILPVAWGGPGSGNQVVDPLLNLGVLTGTPVANVTAAQLRQAAQLLPGSPAIGAGFGGRNLGGLQPHGIVIAGEPIGTTTNTSATLRVGPGGTFNWGTNTSQRWGWMAFKWKLDTNAWSAEIPVGNNSPFSNPASITLSNLSIGPHTVFVTGRNDVGYYQDDTFVYPADAGIPASITASRTWTVASGLRIDSISLVSSNEVQIQFTAEGNTGYTIQYRDSLSTGSWQPLVHLDPVPSAHTVIFTDSPPPGTPMRFYQLSNP